MLNALRNILIGSAQQEPEESAHEPAIVLEGSLLLDGKTLFEDAQLQIVATSVEYQHQLCCEDLASPNEELWLIDDSLHFYYSKRTNTLHWENYTFQLRTKDVSAFITEYLHAVYERKFHKSRLFATPQDLLDLTFDPAVKSTKAVKEQLSQPADVPAVNPTPKIQFTSAPSENKVIASASGELHLYNPSTCEFVSQASGATISLLDCGSFKYWLSVLTKDGAVVLMQPLDYDLSPVFSAEFSSFIWIYRDLSTECSYSWSLRFASVEQMNAFRVSFSQCMYECMAGEKFSKVKDEDQNYLMNAYNDDVDMTDAEEEDEESDEEVEERTIKSSKPSRIPEEASTSDGKNSQLAVAYKHDRSFVVRGSKIGVFRNDRDSVDYDTTINSIATPKGKVFAPSKMMLHDQDSCMILKGDEAGKLYRMDLERGIVTDEWMIDPDRKIVDFTSDSKYGQMTPQKTFIGVANNSLFRIDPRQSGQKLVDSQLNQYKTKMEFRAAVTTGKGDLIVSSDKGDLRLYDKLEKRAKTHLPGLGDAIIGVDASEDGKWILATCKTYLLLVGTEAMHEGETISGFKKSLGSHKPVPKRLTLKPEHVAWINEPISFTPARFDTGSNMEKKILTSTGPYVITWNLRRVRAGHKFDYTIKKYPDLVVADNFKYGSDQVIVTLPDDVTMAGRGEFDSPVKALGMGTPRKQHLRKTDVVNSPY